MRKFETLLKETGRLYLLTEEDLGVTQPSSSEQEQPTGIDQVQPKENEANASEPEKVTSEGKRFLIELALKALSVNPHEISEQDKSIFNHEVTSENADEILSHIQTIVDQNS